MLQASAWPIVLAYIGATGGLVKVKASPSSEVVTEGCRWKGRSSWTPKWRPQPFWSLTLVGERLPTFTTARPSPVPMRKPAGLRGCQEHEVARWKQDRHRFPPYQYKDLQCVQQRGELRTPNVREREAILGFPVGYTVQCMKKSDHNTLAHEDARLSLLGNSWSVGVVAWLLSQFLVWLGLVEPVLIV